MERARTVAVVVPSPALSEVFDATSFTICAPMFSNRCSTSISFATVTPSLVMVGRAEALLDDDVAPLGAERDGDGLGERLDAAQDGLAGGLVEGDVLGHASLLSGEVEEVWIVARPHRLAVGLGRPLT